jgi:hypothetical protein
MLFPKPMGFKFYRDSIRFIGVLAGIAGLGFCVSAVQFIRLGVSKKNANMWKCDLTGIPDQLANHNCTCLGSDHSRCPSRIARNTIDRD